MASGRGYNQPGYGTDASGTFRDPQGRSPTDQGYNPPGTMLTRGLTDAWDNRPSWRQLGQMAIRQGAGMAAGAFGGPLAHEGVSRLIGYFQRPDQLPYSPSPGMATGELGPQLGMTNWNGLVPGLPFPSSPTVNPVDPSEGFPYNPALMDYLGIGFGQTPVNPNRGPQQQTPIDPVGNIAFNNLTDAQNYLNMLLGNQSGRSVPGIGQGGMAGFGVGNASGSILDQLNFGGPGLGMRGVTGQLPMYNPMTLEMQDIYNTITGQLMHPELNVPQSSGQDSSAGPIRQMRF